MKLTENFSRSVETGLLAACEEPSSTSSSVDLDEPDVMRPAVVPETIQEDETEFKLPVSIYSLNKETFLLFFNTKFLFRSTFPKGNTPGESICVKLKNIGVAGFKVFQVFSSVVELRSCFYSRTSIVWIRI